MVGYKIYYNGKKFEMEEKVSEVQSTPSDGTGHWNAGYVTSIEAVNDLNKHLKKNIEELESPQDFVVKKCKDCNEYFVITTEFAEWFKNKGLTLPARCDKCRAKRKKQ